MRPAFPHMHARALALALALRAGVARADRDLCAPGTPHRGTIISLDVAGAAPRDVFRLLADAARLDLVVADGITARITAKLAHVPWDAAACAIAATYQLRLGLAAHILTVTARPLPHTERSAAQR